MTIEERLAAAPLSEDRSAAAARRFTDAADRAGLVDVAWCAVDSPLGPLIAAATPAGLCTLSYRDWDTDEVLDRLARRVSPRVLEAPSRLDPIRRELDEYFAGRRHRFDIAIDWALTAGFTRRVLQATAAIPYGALRTYREVATEAGSPRATRAAGNALGSNPLPIVVPCHRVVRTGGHLGGYTGGLHRKEFLLELEGAALG
jgi:methylated-DNA-[protein]-cysteine S-methyltransferase